MEQSSMYFHIAPPSQHVPARDHVRQHQLAPADAHAFYDNTGSVADVWHLGDWSLESLQLRTTLWFDVPHPRIPLAARRGSSAARDDELWLVQ